MRHVHASPHRIRHGMNAHHGEHKVRRHGLFILIGDLRIPGHLAPALVGAQALARAGEPHFDSIAGFHRFHESQLVEAVIAEHRAVVRIDEQSRRGRNQKVAVRDAAAEQRIARCLGSRSCERKSCLADQCRELLDVRNGDFALGRPQRVAQLQLIERGCGKDAVRDRAAGCRGPSVRSSQ